MNRISAKSIESAHVMMMMMGKSNNNNSSRYVFNAMQKRMTSSSSATRIKSSIAAATAVKGAHTMGGGMNKPLAGVLLALTGCVGGGIMMLSDRNNGDVVLMKKHVAFMEDEGKSVPSGVIVPEHSKSDPVDPDEATSTKSSATASTNNSGTSNASGVSSTTNTSSNDQQSNNSQVVASSNDNQNVDLSFHKLKIFTGSSNKALANEIAGHLGCPIGNATVSRFEDGEVNIRIHENVRGLDVYVIQSTCTPVNENLMELMLMVSTLRRASAHRITAVIPYYGYARQDRKMTARVPISAADVARLLEAMGVDRVVAVDLHTGQIQGFFGPRVPVDNLDGGTVGVDYFGNKKLENPVVVSPDAGGVYRAKKFREGLEKKFGIEAGLAMIIKQRHKPGEIERMDLVGSVADSDAIIVDDMIDTAGTLCKAAEQLKKNGAKRVFAFASHGIFSGKAPKNISESVLEEVVITNTIPLRKECSENKKIHTESVGKLIADAIKRIHEKKSVSALFNENADGKETPKAP